MSRTERDLERGLAGVSLGLTFKFLLIFLIADDVRPTALMRSTVHLLSPVHDGRGHSQVDATTPRPVTHQAEDIRTHSYKRGL